MAGESSSRGRLRFSGFHFTLERGAIDELQQAQTFAIRDCHHHDERRLDAFRVRQAFAFAVVGFAKTARGNPSRRARLCLLASYKLKFAVGIVFVLTLDGEMIGPTALPVPRLNSPVSLEPAELLITSTELVELVLVTWIPRPVLL